MNFEDNDNGTLGSIKYNINNGPSNFNNFRNFSGRLVMNGADIAENINGLYDKGMSSTISDRGKNIWNRNEDKNSFDKERKRTFLSNIEQQLTMTNKNKLMEYEKKRKEDERYLSEMQHYNPFGRGGAGAPIRDKYGNVVTSRKALISDPKYHRGNVNVDEEYSNLMRDRKFNKFNTGKSTLTNNIFENPINLPNNSLDFNGNSIVYDINPNITNTNLENNSTRINMNSNNNMYNNNPIMNVNPNYNNMIANTVDPYGLNNINPNTFSNYEYNINSNQLNYDPLNQNVKTNLNVNFDPNTYQLSNLNTNTNHVGMSNGFALMNNGMGMNNKNNINNNHSLNTSLNNNDTTYNMNSNQPFENKLQQPPLFNNTIPTTNINTSVNPFNQQPNLNNQNTSLDSRFNHIPSIDTGALGLNLSSNGYEDIKRQQKQQYGEILREQIRLNEERKEKEKEQRKLEEMEEDARIKREQELMKTREDQEKEKKKKEMDKFQQQNDLIREQFVQAKQKRNRNNDNNNKETEKLNSFNQQQHVNDFKSENQISSQTQFINNDLDNPENNHIINPTNNFIIVPDNKEDIEIKNAINSEILNLRSDIIDQQSTFLKQINDLKVETQNANLHRYEAMKEISQLKEEISKQRIDEELRRKYVYDVMVDKNIRANEVLSNLKLPELNEKELRVEVQKIRNHSDNVKGLYYEDTIKHPNRIRAVPKLDEIQEITMKTTSKFIDMDTHNVLDSLNLYEPGINNANKNKKIIERENAKGFEVDGEFVLRSYCRDDERSDGIIPIKTNSEENSEYFENQKKKYQDIFKKDKENGLITNVSNIDNINQNNKDSDKTLNFKIRNSPLIIEDKNLNKDFKSYVDEDIETKKKTMDDDTLNIYKVYNKNLERLRYLNRLEDEENTGLTQDSKNYFNYLKYVNTDNYLENNQTKTREINYNSESNKDYLQTLNKQYTKAKNFEVFLDKLNTIKES